MITVSYYVPLKEEAIDLSPEGMEKRVTFNSPILSLVKECPLGVLTLLHCQVCLCLRMAEWILTDNWGTAEYHPCNST